jgi:hypothetical protein
MRLQLTKRFLACVKKLSATDRAAVDVALGGLLSTFGNPHAHGGQSVRVLKAPVYEVRATLALRIVFVRQGESLIADMVGTHGEVRDYLKNRR